MIIDSPIISGSFAASGSLNQFGNVVISGSLTVTGSIIGTASFATTASYLSGYVSPFPFTGSAVISGSLEVTGSANIPNITGSLLGTASFANTATSSSFATTASFSLNVPVTSSYANNATSASFATTASYLTGYISPFPYTGSAIISGSLGVTGSFSATTLSGIGTRYLVTDASGSVTAQTASAAIKQTQAFTSSANQTSFTIADGYTTGLVDVFINGSKLAPGVEFTDTSGTVITLATGSNSGDLVEFVKYFPASGVTNNALRQLTTFTASAGQTVFSASYTPGLLDIFYNGSRLSNNEYTANNGTFFTLATASIANDILDVFVYSYQVGAFSGIGGAGVANQIAFYNTTSSITGSSLLTVSGNNVAVNGTFSVLTGSATELQVNATGVRLGNAITDTHTVTGSLNMSGSFSTVGTITAQTLVIQTVTSSTVYSSGSNIFGNNITNTQVFTGSVSVTGSISSNGKLTITTSTSPGFEIVKDASADNRYIRLTNTQASGKNWDIINQTNANNNNFQIYNNTDNIGVFLISPTGSVSFGAAITNTHTITGSVNITGSLAVRAANSSFGIGYYNAAGTLTGGFYNTSTGHGQIYLYNSSSVQTMQIDGSGGSAIFASTVTATNGVRCINSGVDSVFQDAFVGVYSSNNNEQNAIQSSVSSTAQNSGFRFQASNGGGSAGRTTVADFLRDRQIFYHNVLPAANGTQDLGSSSLRWGTVFTSDLDMSNGIGDYTIVEGEEDLFLYNNKTNKVFKFMIQEVDPSEATPKMKK